MRFTGKTVLILGGNSGIGRASAEAFEREGAQVLITGRDQKTIDETVAAITDARGFRADIADLAAMDALVATLRADYPRIDVLFVNAGVGAFAPVREITPELWDDVHNVNLRGCFFAVQKLLPLLGKGSVILLTGSIGAEAALAGNTVYAAAKAGLRAVMRILAKELIGEGIRVNMVSPGPTETPIINRNAGPALDVDALRAAMIAAVPMHRMGRPDEIASAALFLASEDASFITAADLYVDGGTMELR